MRAVVSSLFYRDPGRLSINILTHFKESGSIRAWFCPQVSLLLNLPFIFLPLSAFHPSGVSAGTPHPRARGIHMLFSGHVCLLQSFIREGPNGRLLEGPRMDGQGPGKPHLCFPLFACWQAHRITQYYTKLVSRALSKAGHTCKGTKIFPLKDYYICLKEWNSAICSNIDGPKDDHIKWNKSDRERQILSGITYMRNLKKWYKWTYLQNRNRLTDTENELMVTKGDSGG